MSSYYNTQAVQSPLYGMGGLYGGGYNQYGQPTGYSGQSQIGSGLWQQPGDSSAMLGPDYYSTAGSNGQIGMERFISGALGSNNTASKYGQWLRNNESGLYNQYSAAQGQNPSLKWTDWLQQNQGSLNQQYNAQTPSQKGEYETRTVRWL
jgi:hypothetical protein